MIAVDTNILVQAHRAEMPFHPQARDAVARLAEGPKCWALPWPCAHEFLAIVTSARVFKTPTPLAAAIDQLREWLASPSAVPLSEEAGYFEILARLLAASRVTGARIHDARIAALCLAHGVDELWTADRDFSRFVELRTSNPLAGP